MVPKEPASQAAAEAPGTAAAAAAAPATIAASVIYPREKGISNSAHAAADAGRAEQQRCSTCGECKGTEGMCLVYLWSNILQG